MRAKNILLCLGLLSGGFMIRAGEASNARLSMGAVITAITKWEELGKTPLSRQISKITMHQVKFEKVALDDAFKQLRTSIADSGGPKLNFFIQAPAEYRRKQVTMDLVDLPLSDAIRYICMQTGLVYQVEEHAIVFKPAPPGHKY